MISVTQIGLITRSSKYSEYSEGATCESCLAYLVEASMLMKSDSELPHTTNALLRSEQRQQATSQSSIDSFDCFYVILGANCIC